MTVIDPHVSVDGVPDWRTVDDLLESILHEGMSDEARVLAVFHTVRRLFVHGPVVPELAYDYHRVVHVLGTGACLSMTTPLHLLYDRLGYRSQSWVHDAHHMMQLEYGGGWHCLDPHMSFSVYDRSHPPQLASIDQLRADPSLARDAVAEGRAGAGYLLCGDDPAWFADDEGEWYLEAGGAWPDMRVDEPFGRIVLRPGETYVRTWHPGRHWWRAGWLAHDACGPIHHCAEADRRDMANWPLYEPHAWVRPADGRTYYRAWGVGRLEYVPRFGDGTWRRGLAPSAALAWDHGPAAGRAEGPGDGPTARRNVVVVDGALAAADARHAAEIVFEVTCPYVLTAGEVDLTLARSGDVAAWVRVRDRRTLPAVEPDRTVACLAHDWAPLALQSDGAGALRAAIGDEVNGCFEGYQLRLRLGDGAALGGLRLLSHFQLNRYSLPYLRPGRNTVRIQARRCGAPLRVGYEWSEGDGWRVPRVFEAVVHDDAVVEIDVSGPCWPRMQALTLAV